MKGVGRGSGEGGVYEVFCVNACTCKCTACFQVGKDTMSIIYQEKKTPSYDIMYTCTMSYLPSTCETDLQ